MKGQNWIQIPILKWITIFEEGAGSKLSKNISSEFRILGGVGGSFFQFGKGHSRSSSAGKKNRIKWKILNFDPVKLLISSYIWDFIDPVSWVLWRWIFSEMKMGKFVISLFYANILQVMPFSKRENSLVLLSKSFCLWRLFWETLLNLKENFLTMKIQFFKTIHPLMLT